MNIYFIYEFTYISIYVYEYSTSYQCFDYLDHHKYKLIASLYYFWFHTIKNSDDMY